MTDFERVIELVAELEQVVINSHDHTINDIVIDIDTYDLYDDMISIGSLNGDEIIISKDDIVKVDDQVVMLKNYRLEFCNKI